MPRRIVAVTPINRTLYSDFFLLTSGETRDIYIQNATTTDGAFGPDVALQPPGGISIEEFRKTAGNLLNIAIRNNTLSTNIEMYIHEGRNGTPLGWSLADAVLITSQTPHFTRAFRFICPFVRVRISNTSPSTAAIDVMVRGSSS